MMLQLHELAKQGKKTEALILKERLPDYVFSPCQLKATYQVESQGNFYLVRLSVSGDLRLCCQRCMDEFTFNYDNDVAIAVCRSDERAEQLLEYYECIVAINDEISIEDLVVDELYLYAPMFHPASDDCNSEINQILTEKNEAY